MKYLYVRHNETVGSSAPAEPQEPHVLEKGRMVLT